MAETNWLSISLKPPFAKEVGRALDSGEAALNNITDILNVIKTILEVAKLIAALLANNPIEAVIKQIIEQIEKLLDGLLQDTRIHGIYIPIQKQPFGLGIEVDLNAIVNDKGTTIPSAAQLQEDGKLNKTTTAYADTNIRDFINFLDTADYAVGGNRGFYRTLVESVRDEGDPNRPTFTENFAVVGGCLLLGSRSLTAIYELVALLNALLKLGDRTDPLRNAFPIVQNLKARVIPITTSGETSFGSNVNKIGVVLTWDPLPGRIHFPLYNDEEAIIHELVVIRSTDPSIRQKFTWSEVFDSDIPNNQKILPSTATGQTKVISRRTFDGITNSYVDWDSSLKKNTVYYYTVVPRYKIDDKFLPMKSFSNMVRVEYRRPLVTGLSEPPDWIATPSLLELFPILEEIIGYIKLVLAEVSARSITNPPLLQQLIELIEFLVKKGEKAVAILRAILDVIRRLFNTEVGGVYATTFSIEEGGIDAWNAELARRLSLSSDPSRPPFDDPHDLTTGIVLVTGVPIVGGIDVTANMNEQQRLLEALYALIFGGSDKSESEKRVQKQLGQTSARSGILFALETLETAVAEAEKKVFKDDLTAVPESKARNSEIAAQEKPKMFFDKNMTPIKTIC